MRERRSQGKGTGLANGRDFVLFMGRGELPSNVDRVVLGVGGGNGWDGRLSFRIRFEAFEQAI